MARATLTPVILTPNSGALNLTTTASGGVAPNGTGAGNGVQFPNVTGLTKLLVSVGATPTTLTVVIGTTVFGQTVAGGGISVGPLATTALVLVGPFSSAVNQPGGNIVAVDFSSITAILCAVLQDAGVY